MNENNFSTKQIADIAILLGVAIILQLITFMFVIFNIGIGGSISISMLPLFIIIYRHGFKAGVVSGILYGLFEMVLYSVLVASLAESLQVFLAIVALDYIVAFGILAFASFIFSIRKGHQLYFVLGIIIAGLLRYSVHVISGVLLFRDWLGEAYPDLPFVIGSIVLNSTYMVPSIVMTALIGGLIFNRIRSVLNEENIA